MVALRKIADGMTNGEGEEDEGDSEEAGGAAGSKESVSSSRRVSWLKRGKMAPSYDDDDGDDGHYGVEDDDEGDNDDEDYGVEDDDDEGDNDGDEGYDDDEAEEESESEVCGVSVRVFKAT